jgi:hypothetical protein
MCFVDASFLLGDEFENHPDHAWARPFLRPGAATPEDRAIDLLDNAEDVVRVSKRR